MREFRCDLCVMNRAHDPAPLAILAGAQLHTPGALSADPGIEREREFAERRVQLAGDSGQRRDNLLNAGLTQMRRRQQPSQIRRSPAQLEEIIGSVAGDAPGPGVGVIADGQEFDDR